MFNIDYLTLRSSNHLTSIPKKLAPALAAHLVAECIGLDSVHSHLSFFLDRADLTHAILEKSKSFELGANKLSNLIHSTLNVYRETLRYLGVVAGQNIFSQNLIYELFSHTNVHGITEARPVLIKIGEQTLAQPPTIYKLIYISSSEQDYYLALRKRLPLLPHVASTNFCFFDPNQGEFSFNSEDEAATWFKVFLKNVGHDNIEACVVYSFARDSALTKEAYMNLKIESESHAKIKEVECIKPVTGAVRFTRKLITQIPQQSHPLAMMLFMGRAITYNTPLQRAMDTIAEKLNSSRLFAQLSQLPRPAINGQAVSTSLSRNRSTSNEVAQPSSMPQKQAHMKDALRGAIHCGIKRLDERAVKLQQRENITGHSFLQKVAGGCHFALKRADSFVKRGKKHD